MATNPPTYDPMSRFVQLRSGEKKWLTGWIYHPRPRIILRVILFQIGSCGNPTGPAPMYCHPQPKQSITVAAVDAHCFLINSGASTSWTLSSLAISCSFEVKPDLEKIAYETRSHRRGEFISLVFRFKSSRTLVPTCLLDHLHSPASTDFSASLTATTSISPLWLHQLPIRSGRIGSSPERARRVTYCRAASSKACPTKSSKVGRTCRSSTASASPKLNVP